MSLGGFFALSIAGIIAGFIYEVGVLIRFLLKNKIWFTVIVDFFVACFMGVCFVFAEFKYLNFVISFYSVSFFVFGIILERISIGFLLAKNLFRIYNYIVRLLSKFSKTKLGRKITK